MKKNALLTFLFACIPGAGQMYYGYMQRGLALISLFCVTFLLGSLAGPLVVTMGIVWMYSFFDTYDLIRHLAAGDPKPDGLLLLGDWSDLKTLVPKHNRLLGWGLIVLGVWALYDLSTWRGASLAASPPSLWPRRSSPPASGCWACTRSAGTITTACPPTRRADRPPTCAGRAAPSAHAFLIIRFV